MTRRELLRSLLLAPALAPLAAALAPREQPRAVSLLIPRGRLETIVESDEVFRVLPLVESPIGRVLETHPDGSATIAIGLGAS